MRLLPAPRWLFDIKLCAGIGAVGLISWVGCTGNIGDGNLGGSTSQDEPTPAELCEVANPGPDPMRRLNKVEYTYTIADLFGYQAAADGFPDENVVDGYDNNVENTSISQLRADQMFAAAEAVGAATTADLDALLPCTVNTLDDACVDSFISTMGRRGYRHPLDETERNILRAVYDADPSWTPQDRLRLVLEAIIMAPQFVYRAEIGNTAAEKPQPNALPLTGYEVATRMAYLLWASTPDEELLDAAEAGELDTAAGVEAQARRMVGDERARRGMMNFMLQWIDARGLTSIERDATTYPTYGPATAASMHEETRRFLEKVVFENAGSISDLLLTNDTTVDATLADIYGVPHPGDASWVDVTLDAETRSGILTLSGFLANKAHAISPAPVQRGIFVRKRLLCQDIPDPPDDVDISPKTPGPTETNRQLLAEHSSNPVCTPCHKLMDPIGFGFENFDSLGNFRLTEGDDLPIDASGELTDTEDIDGPFVGAVELAEKLAQSTEVQACMATQTFRYAYGRRPTEQDHCSVDQVQELNVASGGGIGELLIAITLTDGFRFRHVEEAN